MNALRIASSLLFAGGLLAAPAISNASGLRLPWQSAGHSKPAASPTPAAAPTPPAAPAATAAREESGESAFLERTHQQLQQWIADGDLAASHASQSAVKSFGKTLASQCRSMDSQIAARQKAVGATPGAASPTDATLAGKTGTAFDDAFLTKVIESNESFLPGFATSKESEPDHAFHAVLVQDFDTMKQQREQAHTLLDETHRAERQQVRGTTTKK